MNWIYLGAVGTILWVLLMRAADAEQMHRMGALGKRLQRAANYREMRFRAAIANEVSAALDKIIPRMTYDSYHPPDDIVQWLVDVEVENRAARGFILAEPKRTSDWIEFFETWRAVNRP